MCKYRYVSVFGVWYGVISVFGCLVYACKFVYEGMEYSELVAIPGVEVCVYF